MGRFRNTLEIYGCGLKHKLEVTWKKAGRGSSKVEHT